MARLKGWIKLQDSKRVVFPNECPYSGLKADTVKEYVVENTSAFWIFMRILRVGQYITLQVPFNDTGLKRLKKVRRKAMWVGLLMGAILAIGALFGSVAFMVEADTKRARDIFMMIGGITFVFALILGPALWLWREHLNSGPLYFRKNGKQLWVKIRNANYKEQFLILNEHNLKEDNSSEEDILDVH